MTGCVKSVGPIPFSQITISRTSPFKSAYSISIIHPYCFIQLICLKRQSPLCPVFVSFSKALSFCAYLGQWEHREAFVGTGNKVLILFPLGKGTPAVGERLTRISQINTCKAQFSELLSFILLHEFEACFPLHPSATDCLSLSFFPCEIRNTIKIR